MLRAHQLIAAAVLALLAAACSSSGGAPTAGRSPTSTATSPTSPGTTPDGTRGPSTDPTGPAPSATKRGGGSATTTVVAARATPPRPGTYRYAQEGVSLYGEMPEEGTLVVGRADTRARQTHTREVSPNEVTEQQLRFTPDGIQLLAATQRFGSGAIAQSYECRFTPALMLIELPLEVGDRMSARSSCDGEDIEVSYDARALRTETRVVGGRAVETVVLRATITASGDGVSQTTTSTSWLSPVYRLVVRSEQRTEGRQGAFSFYTSLTEELLDLRPR